MAVWGRGVQCRATTLAYQWRTCTSNNHCDLTAVLMVVAGSCVDGIAVFHNADVVQQLHRTAKLADQKAKLSPSLSDLNKQIAMVALSRCVSFSLSLCSLSDPSYSHPHTPYHLYLLL